MMFVMGVVLFSTLALIPPLLQGLLNYPVVTTGLVTAPRGLGGVAALFVVGRIMGKVDTRLFIGAGFALSAFASWQMAGYDLQMDTASVVWPRFCPGPGHGPYLRAARVLGIRHALAGAAQ